MLSLKK